MLNFRTIENLNLAIVNKITEIRKLNVDLIVGIPRSGMLPATILATHLQLPFTDIDSYNANRWYVRNKKVTVPDDIPNKPLRILLVDDTINSGNAMRKTLSTIKKTNDTIIKFAVYGSPKNKSSDINFICEECPLPRAFQWNLWKHNQASEWATDMDGVLCRDPNKKENDKGLKLNNFYQTAEPRFLFQKPVKYIITSREEKFRTVTLEWLNTYNIQFEGLFMKPNDMPGGNESHALYKANKLNSLGVKLYIESDPKQAKIIAKKVNMPIWCTDNQSIYNVSS